MIFKDARGVVYPCSRATEMHGVQEIDPDADAPDLREMLRSTYHFGTSIPHGFHHDAQFEYGRRFDKTRFIAGRELRGARPTVKSGNSGRVTRDSERTTSAAIALQLGPERGAAS